MISGLWSSCHILPPPPVGSSGFDSLKPHLLMTPQQSEVPTPDSPAQSGQNQEENDEFRLPPFASNGDVNIWFSTETDKNGDTYLVIDAPFLQPERVFVNDDLKNSINEIRDSWEAQKKNQGDE